MKFKGDGRREVTRSGTNEDAEFPTTRTLPASSRTARLVAKEKNEYNGDEGKASKKSKKKGEQGKSPKRDDMHTGAEAGNMCSSGFLVFFADEIKDEAPAAMNKACAKCKVDNFGQQLQAALSAVGGTGRVRLNEITNRSGTFRVMLIAKDEESIAQFRPCEEFQ